MENHAGFAGMSVRTVAQEFALLILSALATGATVAVAAMGLVLLLAR